MKKFYKLLILLFILVTPLTAATSPPKYNENAKINLEITTLIDNGTLPNWHSEYLSNTYYQRVFLNFKNSLSYFASLSKSSLEIIINSFIRNDTDFIEIINNLSVPVTELKINQTIGIFYTGQLMQMIWTSEYIPHESLNLKTITVNGVTLIQQLINKPSCPYIHGDGVFEVTFSYGFPTENKQINLTPIGGYVMCGDDVQKYGINVEQKTWKIERWSAGMESVVHNDHPDPTNYYNFQCDDSVTFELTAAPKINAPAVSQLTSHEYIELTEVEAQSTYDVFFGGYKHFVYFNTPIEMEKIYRVDCNYTLASDNKEFWQIWLDGSAKYEVQKSLTAAKNQAGLFNMFSYKDLTEGNYASNEKSKTFYKYKLHLNYNESNWNIFSSHNYPESRFKRIQAFNIFRINFLYHGEEIDMEVKMDTIAGDTFMLFDRSLIMSTSDPIWKVKETGYDISDEVADGVNDFIKSFQTVLIIGATIIIALAGLSIYEKVKKTFKKSD